MIPKYDSLSRLKELFRELFQLDTADLDFGLYRLFRIKRVEIEAFLEKQLPAEVEKAFASVSDAERQSMQKQVEALARQARESIADDAIFRTGQPNPRYAGTKAVKEYVEACTRLEAVSVSEAQRAEVFNQLYAFFSRYYDEGDFIPRRFFGARSAYAVAYNGEEVFFHWANKDQYYVKSGEAFRDYAFTIPTLQGEYGVRLKLVEATTPKDNTKGDTRFFFPRPEEAVFDKTSKTLTLPFEYRLPTESEAARYGARNKAQEAILDEATPKILRAINDDILCAALAAPSPTGRESDNETPPSLLRRRFTHFTRKNTTDYFVHKNLGAFLRQELEFFIRDQIVHEADLEGDFDAKRRMLRVFRKLADTVITFLAQIEDAQKRLFEKKKFVLRTDYLIPIQNVPRDLWKEVLANKAQLEEWKVLYALEPKSDLFNLKGKINEYVLEQNPTLVMDTRHFTPDFSARLLVSIENLDEWTDGVLIHGENLQALNLMLERYREGVKCIHIDPPYNTDTSGFLYKNTYRHSSWLSMMGDRLSISKGFLTHNGNSLCHVDENEYERLQLAFDHLGLPGAGTVVWDKRNPMLGKKGIATQHEYVCWRGFSQLPVYVRSSSIHLILSTAKAIIAKHGCASEAARKEFAKWISGQPKLTGGERAYKYLDDAGRVYQSVAMGAPEPRTDPKFFVPIIHPVTNKPCPMPPNGWSRAPETISELLERNEIIFGADESVQPRRKVYLDEGSLRQLSSIISDSSRGKGDIDALGLNFPYCHPVTLYVDLIGAAVPDRRNSVLDYFAGSGTTGHAVINLNREDGGRRTFILVEMADYFDTVLVPRIKKVMFTPEWKDGKPKRLAAKEEAERTPRLVKVLRLESYEDALHNTFSESAFGRIAEREKAVKQLVGDEAYRIHYLVKLPLDASDVMLNLAKLEHPFDYTMDVLTNFGPKTQTVDLVETFNWLYGLRVKRIFTWVNPGDKTPTDKDGRLYRAVTGTDREGKKRVLVVWRDMKGLDPVKDRAFLEGNAAEIGPFDERWINGDTAARGFASLDGLFKRLMAGGEV
jgi:adenine-specific DNA-methyltransferase